MEKRWIAFFLIFFMAYFLFMVRHQQRAREIESAQAEAQAAQLIEETARQVVGDDADDAPPGLSDPDGGGQSTPAGQASVDGAPVDSGAEAPRSERIPLELTTINTGLAEVTFSNEGAVPVSWVLLPSEFIAPVFNDQDGTTRTIDLIPQVTDTGIRERPFQFEGRTIANFNRLRYHLDRTTDTDGAEVLAFQATDPDTGMAVEKTYRLLPDSYASELDVRIRNAGARTPLGDPESGWGIGWQGGFFEPSPTSRLTGTVYSIASVNGDVRTRNLKADSDPIVYPPEIGWAGQMKKYFLAVIAPHPETPVTGVQFTVRQRNMSPEYLERGIQAPMSVVLRHAGRTLEPGEVVSTRYSIVVSPKDYGVLMGLEPPMVASALPLERIAFGQMPLGQDWIRPISILLLRLLRWIEGYVHNWGWAIIVLVLIVKTVLYPLSHWAIKNQAKTMVEQKRIKPYLDELNKKYKDDPQKKTQEVMKLYREHNINPLGMLRGCFPMLLQMPIFFALYILLDQAVEIRGQSFLWMTDLSRPDRLIPFSQPIMFIGDGINILPFLMAGTQYFTSKLMATNIEDPMQKQIMVMMPIMFCFILYHMPSGLMLYWTVQNVWQIGHTVLTKRYVAMHDEAPPNRAAAASTAS